MRVRAAVIAIAALAALALSAPAANACQFPDLMLLKPQAGPGENVPFTISNTSAGAQWTVQIGGTSVSGVATGRSVSGSITMPNLGGSAVGLKAYSSVSHSDIEGGSWPDSYDIQYAPPAAAAPTPGQQPAGAKTPSTPTAGDGTGQPASGAPSTGHFGSSRHLGGTAPGSVAAPAPGAQVGTASGVASPGAAVSTAHRSATSRPAPAEAAGGAARADVAATALTAERARSGFRAPALAIAALALLLLGGLGGIGVLVMRRRAAGPPPDQAAVTAVAIPSDAEIEAELQEMIAEQRAQAVAGDRVRERVRAP